MSKTFQQLLNETLAPTKVKPVATKVAPKAKKTPVKAKAPVKPVAKKSAVNESALSLSDLGIDVRTQTAKSKKVLNEFFAMAPISRTVNVDAPTKKSPYDLDMADIGFIMESEEDEVERGEENSQDTMEDEEDTDDASSDGVPPSGAATMSAPSGDTQGEPDDEAEADQEDGEMPPVGGDAKKFQTVSLTVPALMKVLKAVSQKTPDNVTVASMVMSMAHFCDGGCDIDVKDLEEIKHKMHGMEYAGSKGADDADQGDDQGDDANGSPDPSTYATDDVVDGSEGEASDEGDQDTETGDDISSDGEAEDGTSDEEKSDDAAKDEEESGDESEEEMDECDKFKGLDEDIEAVFESVTTNKDITAIRRRSGLANYWKN